MSNVGAWDAHWSDLVNPVLLGGAEVYRRIAAWLADEPLVEDWGCGPGGLRDFVGAERYRGVDGSASPFADVHADLRSYTPRDRPAIAMRAVLEHNDDWQDVLDNAVEAFGHRMVIGLFTPLTRETTLLMREPDYGDVPVISFALHDLTQRFDAKATWTLETFASPHTEYGIEHLIYMERF